MKKSTLSWSSLFLVTFLAAYLYIFNEWLFAVTKPSFFNGLSSPKQLQIFLTTSALLASLCFFCLLPLVILGQISPLKRNTQALIQLGGGLPAVIFTALILILIDNFTYTMFKFGVVSTDGWSRALYGLGFILVVVLCYRRVLKTLVGLSHRTRIWGLSSKWIFSFLAGVLLLSVAVLAFPNPARTSSLSTSGTAGAQFRPHILLITADGVNATHMSVYGYERNTTPHLQELAESALVAENAFSNSGKTSGSVISIYTGKYPAKTRLLFPPDILKGADAYEHLPGILRSQGYRTVQITFPHYLDANDLNVLDGFDEVKTRSSVHSKYLSTISKILPTNIALFTDETINRMLDRIRHIFFITKMTNPYLLVTGVAEPLEDIERLEALKQEIHTSGQPVFVHVHLMATHGEKLNPLEQKFSAGQSIDTQGPRSIDFYDDSILEIDKHLGELTDYLSELGLIDNTLLIIGSDHGRLFDSLKRLPFIIRFPHGQYAGRIQANVQNLDIAPTILDYIGLDQPSWMPGKSLIAGELDQRPIFGVNAILSEDPKDGYSINPEKIHAPFYQFGEITMIYCQKWFKLNLTNLSRESGNVEGSTSACPPGAEITGEQAFQWIVAHLKENGLDVTTLDHFPPWTE